MSPQLRFLLIYGAIVFALVFFLGQAAGIASSLIGQLAFAVICSALAIGAFLFAFRMGQKRNKDD